MQCGSWVRGKRSPLQKKKYQQRPQVGCSNVNRLVELH